MILFIRNAHKRKSMGTESGLVVAWSWGWRITGTDCEQICGIFWE